MFNKFSGRQILVLTAVFLAVCFLVTACGSTNDQYTQQLQAQVSALQTQNALLAAAQNNSSTNSNGNSQATPVPSSSDSGSQVNVVTATAEALPTSPVQAGIPVIYDGWALTLSPEISTGIWNYEEHFKLTFTVRNLGDQARVFRYIKSGVTVTDDLGNSYPFSLADESCDSTPDNLYLPQQITIDSGDTVNIYSMKWDGCSSSEVLPPFKGVLPVNASQLTISINNWGPFNNVVYYLDL